MSCRAPGPGNGSLLKSTTVIGRGRGVRIDEGETSIDSRIGAQCRAQLLGAAQCEHRFARWQAVLLPGSDVLGEQDSAVYDEEPEVARRFRRRLPAAAQIAP